MRKNKKKPFILITNDDGVEAEGIVALAQALSSLGSIVVFAPDNTQSGMSCAITTIKPVSYNLISKSEELTIYSCTGTPVDCVKLALNEVLPVKPDLLVSGINHGENKGLSVHYSGTLGAALEGCVFNVPSFGASLCDYLPGDDFSESCRLVRILAEQVLLHGLPYGTYLNMNIPNISTVKGIAVARQTAGKWVREYSCKEQDGKIQYWLTGDYEMSGTKYPDNDVILLDEGYASLVPCKIDVTDYLFLENLKKWKL